MLYNDKMTVNTTFYKFVNGSFGRSLNAGIANSQSD